MSLDIYLEIEIDTGGGFPHTVQLYEANITHNLNKMASEAELYEFLWRPEELEIKKAGELIIGLECGLVLLKSDPEKFKKFNPENGWGSYDKFIPWIENYLQACKQHPKATIRISR